ncbi:MULTISPECIES: glycosyltransferase [unclassified Diaminobutyricimonas]|uniref:glycosyltransferase n=1 Tax=unclassified Diaminobutyricimonas TaxID=2643261 RepID=UPI001E49294E|nr:MULTISPECIES: glycosyltransferase [unclassified Diaminobutyricimonas]
MPDDINATGPTPSTHDKPLRVLIGADTFAPDVNGAAKFAERLAAGLVARGHDVHVMAPASGPRHGTWTEVHEGATITMHRIYSWRWYPHPWLRFALPWRIRRHSARVLDEVKPDVVHFQSHFVVGRGLAIEANRRRIRVIGTNHTMPDNMMHFTLLPKAVQPRMLKLFMSAMKTTFLRAEAVTTPTRRAADFFEDATGITGVHAISCGIDMANYSPNFEPRTENVVLFIGRVEAEKQIDQMLRAVARLDPALDVKVEIIGDGEQRRNLETLAGELGIRAKVHFAGHVPEEYLKKQLHRATVFAMPSTAELQSIATMEAMATGLPVVAADAMALPHLVHNGVNGYLYQPGDVDEFAARLTDVLTASPTELERMKRESLRIVSAHDIQRTISTFESLYRGEAVTDPVTDVAPAANGNRPDAGR